MAQTTNDLLTNLRDDVAEFSTGFNDKLDQLNAARNNANRAAAAADAMLNPWKVENVIYVSATQGDDNNEKHDSVDTPVKTLGEALERQKALSKNQIRLLTDVNYDIAVRQNVILPYTFILGWNGNARTSTLRTLTIKDNKTGEPSAARLFFDGVSQILRINKVNIHLDSQYPTSCLFLHDCDLLWQVRECTVTQSVTNQAYILNKSFACASRLFLVASLFTADNVDGKIVKDVEAGDPIDDLYWIKSNLITL